jgi:hypothetical protein
MSSKHRNKRSLLSARAALVLLTSTVAAIVTATLLIIDGVSSAQAALGATAALAVAIKLFDGIIE